MIATSRQDPLSRLAELLEPPERDTFALLGYVPTPTQQLLHSATEFDVFYGGAAGGGKTRALVMEGLLRCDQHPGLRAVLFRRSYDELQEGPLSELREVDFGAALGCRWNGTEHELTFPNRSSIRFRYLESSVDASRRQGGQYQLLLLDERTLFAPGVAETLYERVRTKLGGPPVIGIRSTSNPGGPSHGQVKARYVDATNHGQRVAFDEFGHALRFIPARVQDNPHIDAGYLARLDAIPDPARRAAMRDGSWDIFSGQVFVEWRYERHVVQPFTLPEAWPRLAGIDWGYTAPWAVVWAAVDEDRRLWVYRERYATEVGESEQAKRILAAEAEGHAAVASPRGQQAEVPEPPSRRVCDPSMAARRGDASSIREAYEAAGCALHLGNNDRIAGWSRLHEYLSDGPACRIHREAGWERCPRLHVFPGCANLIRTLPALSYSQARPEDVDTHGDDHLGDALRYLLMALGDQAVYDAISDETWAAAMTADPGELCTPFGPYAIPAGVRLHDPGADVDDGWAIPEDVGLPSWGG
jgi:hypothetical protein